MTTNTDLTPELRAMLSPAELAAWDTASYMAAGGGLNDSGLDAFCDQFFAALKALARTRAVLVWERTEVLRAECAATHTEEEHVEQCRDHHKAALAELRQEGLVP